MASLIQLQCIPLIWAFLFVPVIGDPWPAPSACALPLPKSYVSYHLGKGEKIVVDGKLDDAAWKEVGWTLPFMDIQGPLFPKPRFLTLAKMRWDDYYLYIGAYLEETDVWANQTKHDSVIFYDNDFEVFIDPDGSTHYYKEFEINALDTTWDLELNKPYIDGGHPNSSWEMPTMKSGIFVDGPINNPLVKDHYWTVELAFPFKDLIHGTRYATAPPKNGDTWRINFSRVEWKVRNVNGHYEKVPGEPADNWVWSSQSTINMHLPERWGFVQFSIEPVNSTKFHYDPNKWSVYTNLVQVYNAEREFKAANGYYTADVGKLTELPDYVQKGVCAAVPKVNASSSQYEATCSPYMPESPTYLGHIRYDRLIWFTED